MMDGNDDDGGNLGWSLATMLKLVLNSWAQVILPPKPPE